LESDHQLLGVEVESTSYLYPLFARLEAKIAEAKEFEAQAELLLNPPSDFVRWDLEAFRQWFTNSSPGKFGVTLPARSLFLSVFLFLSVAHFLLLFLQREIS
jgi:hypothetical protein